MTEEANAEAAYFDVIVVGGGMVGAALTALLAEAGMQVAMVEARQAPLKLENVGTGLPTPRVSALTPVSQRLLTHLGAWPLMQAKRVTPYRYMQVWDAEGSGEVKFSAEQAGVTVLGHIVENDVTQASLETRLAQHSQARLYYAAKVSALHSSPAGARRLVLDDGRELEAPLIVAADGAHSSLRHMAGISVSQEDTGQQAVVTTVRCAEPHGGNARQAFLAGSPLAFLPLTVDGDEHYCSIVWSTSAEHAEALCAMSRAELGDALSAAFGEHSGEVQVCDDARCFPLIQRHAHHYVLDGLALVGDAAHSIHPLAGQGVNLGFMDAAVLAEEVVTAWRRGAPWGDSRILARYERRRRWDNTSMLALMMGFKQLFGARHPAVTLMRNLGLNSVNRVSLIKRLLMRQATGERGQLPASCR
ncbi:UbiH/UbiF/VisC/COQ6 family ubiquinone biosynthesis hydroxylase [Vreelandella rituensis]|uniref:2-octaprenyl-3-methyl-6-methoxy-1,4-benzoquinol hydroxylase n=1 Tax=Vreelandella rituensis TaxID=2282306 RepID=A0A368U638_9GAMM|nr:UbiH/UbiF/VisC/COQ6 family ubiquinone biosynthesis hydroxylase [Halomonas rituensis]RCV92465.1 2-octaprenyl-3-methyl-6-methoxy-1,4-benzoquinol hydroxylase [Halomonas rituensis]